MKWAHVRHIPVVDPHDRAVGIVGCRDVPRGSLSAADTRFTPMERKRHLTELQVAAVMHRPVRALLVSWARSRQRSPSPELFWGRLL